MNQIHKKFVMFVFSLGLVIQNTHATEQWEGIELSGNKINHAYHILLPEYNVKMVSVSIPNNEWFEVDVRTHPETPHLFSYTVNAWHGDDEGTFEPLSTIPVTGIKTEYVHAFNKNKVRIQGAEMADGISHAFIVTNPEVAALKECSVYPYGGTLDINNVDVNFSENRLHVIARRTGPETNAGFLIVTWNL